MGISVFAQAQKKNAEATPVTDDKNAVPATHPIFRMVNDPSHYSLQDADSFYQNEISKEATANYTTNLKNLGFTLVMEKGLADTGTDEQKRYYVNEQLKLDSNLTTIDKFYELLLTCRSFDTKENLYKDAAAFYEKNRAAINKKQWPNAEDKKQITLELMNKHKIFNRYIAVAMKD
jgi:hypothetical protein